MLSFECIKNEKSVYFLLTSASFSKSGQVWLQVGQEAHFTPQRTIFSTGIFLFAIVPMNAEVMGIIEGTFMPPIRKPTGFDLFGDGSWILA